MILLDREKDSAVNNTRSGRYNGLKPIEIHGEEERNSKCLCSGFRYIPVINSTGSEVGVENSDDNRGCVSKNGIIDNIQEFNQLQQTNPTDKHFKTLQLVGFPRRNANERSPARASCGSSVSCNVALWHLEVEGQPGTPTEQETVCFRPCAIG